jgi:hypothetical protein
MASTRSRSSLFALAVVALVAAAGIEAFTRRHNMAPDGMSYLDVASAYRAGDFKTAINSYWSPLFSWAIAATVLLGGSRATLAEPARVHALMFGCFLLALITVSFAIREAIRFVESRAASDAESEPLPRRWWWIAGYALFAWSSLELISLETVNPDILVSAFVYLTFALLFRIARGDTRLVTALCLGLTLGAGYLAKAAMFPLGLVSLCVAGVLYSRHLPNTRLLRTLALSGFGFLLLAGPWIGVLSRATGHLTFGSAAKLNYAWLADGIPICCWQGGYNAGVPTHPPRQIVKSPPAYEFAAPIRATFPLWYDPSYWYDGVQPRVHLVHQVSLFITNLSTYLPDFGWVLAIMIVAFALATSGMLRLADWRYWSLFILALATFGLYALVYTETRYVGGSAVALCLVFLAGLRPADRGGSAALRAVALALAIPAVTLATFRTVADLRFGVVNATTGGSEEDFTSRKNVPPRQPQSIAMATALNALAIPEGTPVAVVGYGANAYWARLAHLRILSELQGRDAFWGANDSIQQPIIDAMRRAGAQLIVADDPPSWADTHRWQRLGNTRAVMLDLRSQTASRQ